MTKDPDELEQLFLSGQCPTLESLVSGERIDEAVSFAEWQVTMLTGWFPDLSGKTFRHRKSLIRVGDKHSGCNKIFKNTKWGYFNITPASYHGDGKPAMMLNYDVSPNSFLTRPIQDLIRTTSDPRVLLGRFYYQKVFGGYFTLTRLYECWRTPWA